MYGQFHMRDIARMWSEDLIPLWESDFDVLVLTVIVDAVGRIRPTVATTLRTPRWCADWNDALDAAVAKLAIVVERMTYENDPRLANNEERLAAVRARQHEARIRHKEIRRQQHMQHPDMIRLFQADQVAMGWLRHHYPDEVEKRVVRILAAAGLPRRPPTWGAGYVDGVEAITDAAEKGWIAAPRTLRVDELLALDDDAFRNAVARDVRNQDHRIPELRHPLMLHDWMAALQDLEEMTAPRAATHPDGMNLAKLDFRELRSWPTEDVRKLFNARRFLAGVGQRKSEWGRRVRQLTYEATTACHAINEPWYAAEKQARTELADAHADEYSALRRALDPFGVMPGSNRLDPQKFHNRVRRELKALLLAALADGSWKHLLT